jgi:hypothetical protein
MSPSSIPDEALEFAGFVLVHCASIADANRDGELICPFAVIEKDGTQVINFESETQEEAVSNGWASFNEARLGNFPWAFGREGIYRAPDGAGIDVLTVTVWMPDMQNYYSIVQRFGRRQDQAIFFIGAPELFRHVRAGTAETVEHWDVPALERGVAQHCMGPMWPVWHAPDVPAQ